jgi:hypothetical protein
MCKCQCLRNVIMWKGEKYGILEQVILLPFLKTQRLYQKLVNWSNIKLLSHKHLTRTPEWHQIRQNHFDNWFNYHKISLIQMYR